MFVNVRRFGAALLLCLLVEFAQGQVPSKPLPPGISLLPPDTLPSFSLQGAKESAETQTVAVTGQTFTQALRLRTKTKPASIYAVQLGATPTAPVKKGDVLLARFYVRAVEGGQAETGEARTEFVWEQATEPHTKSVSRPVAIARGAWQRIDVPFVAVQDQEAAQSRILFRLGYAPQVFEIGGISVINYAKQVGLQDLPRTPTTYPGREPDAPWRKEALARIERLRKADLTIVVTDKQNKPIPNADIRVRMRRHAFPFGSAVAADMLLGNDPDRRRYQEMVPKLFNRAVMENDLKWEGWAANPERAKNGVAWLRARNIEVRGHTLVWPSWRHTPKELQALKNDKAALAERVRDHIRDEVGAFRGQLVDWDVVNEPYANHDLLDVLGQQALVEWFRLARATDGGANGRPAPRLFLNDYPPLDGAATDNEHLNHFERTLRFLVDNNAPLDGIGFQCHFGGGVIPPARILSGLDRFAKLGKPIAVTEFDINTTDETLQAEYLRDFVTAAFSHPSVDSIIMWGFWEGRHWKPDAALFRKNWTPKPSGQAWLDLTQKTWWTSADGKTDAQGRYQTRGFLGDYVVTAQENGGASVLPTKLTTNGATLRIVIDNASVRPQTQGKR